MLCSYKRKTNGTMETIKLTEIAIETLWEYREQRQNELSTSGVSVGSVNTYEVDEIAEYICSHGIEPLQLSIAGGKALLTDGNHRLAAASKLGYTHVPVYLVVFPGTCIFLNETFAQFKPLTDEIEDILKKTFL